MEKINLRDCEMLLDRELAIAKGEGADVIVAAIELQKATLRPWVTWVQAMRKDPELMVNGMVNALSHQIAEVLVNVGRDLDDQERDELFLMVMKGMAECTMGTMKSMDGAVMVDLSKSLNDS